MSPQPMDQKAIDQEWVRRACAVMDLAGVEPEQRPRVAHVALAALGWLFEYRAATLDRQEAPAMPDLDAYREIYGPTLTDAELEEERRICQALADIAVEIAVAHFRSGKTADDPPEPYKPSATPKA